MQAGLPWTLLCLVLFTAGVVSQADRVGVDHRRVLAVNENTGYTITQMHVALVLSQETAAPLYIRRLINGSLENLVFCQGAGVTNVFNAKAFFILDVPNQRRAEGLWGPEGCSHVAVVSLIYSLYLVILVQAQQLRSCAAHCASEASWG